MNSKPASGWMGEGAGHVVDNFMGVASGAAMLPYSVIKEANPPELGECCQPVTLSLILELV
jgi:hypothetical protein